MQQYQKMKMIMPRIVDQIKKSKVEERKEKEWGEKRSET